MSVFSSSRWFALGLLALALPASATEPDLRDVQVAFYARRALAQDPELDALNLGVTVHYGRAVVWGVVPSQELAERALRVVENSKGIYGVRSELRILNDQSERAMLELLQGLASPSTHLLPPSESLSESGSGLPDRLNGPPDEPRPQQVLNAHPGLPPSETPDVAPRPALGASVTLLAPVPITAPATPTARPAQLVVAGLSVVAEEIRAADDRFREVRIEVSDGRLTLCGRVSSAETLIDLGRALSRLPGVRHVDLRGVQVSR